MSRLNPNIYTSTRQDWQTPPKVVNALLAFENRAQFDLDPCCSMKNVPAVTHYLYPQFDGSKLPWDIGPDGETLVYANTEYGNALKKIWAPKIYEEAQKGVKIWALIPARTDTQYQHDYLFTKADFTVFIYERLCFWLDGFPYMQLDKKSGKWKEGTAPFPTMLCYFGDDGLAKAQKWILDPPLKGTLMMRYG